MQKHYHLYVIIHEFRKSSLNDVRPFLIIQTSNKSNLKTLSVLEEENCHIMCTYTYGYTRYAYVCIYGTIHNCIHLYTYVHMWLGIYVFYVPMYGNIYAHTHIHMFRCTVLKRFMIFFLPMEPLDEQVALAPFANQLCILPNRLIISHLKTSKFSNI